MKVFGGLTFQNGQQVRTIVAATSKKKAAELLGEKLYYFRAYWSQTRNKIEIDTALSKPETVFVASGILKKDFQPIVKESSGND